MSLDDFLEIKRILRFCPACACVLVSHESNSAILVCPTHGNLFAITQVMAGCKAGYAVAVIDQ